MLRLARSALLALTLGAAVPACSAHPLKAAAELRAVADDALALSDALEARIADGIDTHDDRQFAYEAVLRKEKDTVEYGFARAAIAGRLVQAKGLLAASLVKDVEYWARRSRQLDPNFRGGAATRMLGTLYVLAPTDFLDHGDSEEGLSLLEGLVKARPEDPQNHLRVAEAYVALGDKEPAKPHLCFALAHAAKLRKDEQKLLHKVWDDAGKPPCPSP